MYIISSALAQPYLGCKYWAFSFGRMFHRGQRFHIHVLIQLEEKANSME